MTFKYNCTHRFTKFIEEPAQEEIYECPHYFGMSLDQVIAAGAPQFLRTILDQFPWQGRPTVLQIRPQDFRTENILIDGTWWHCDTNYRATDGSKIWAKNETDMRLMVVSFGGVRETEFVKTPMEYEGWANSKQLLDGKEFEIEVAQPNQLVEYTSLDFHRASPNIRFGKMRLMIVAFESDEIMGNVNVLPSIKDQGK